MLILGSILSMGLVNAPVCFGNDEATLAHERQVLECAHQKSDPNIDVLLVHKATVKGSSTARLYLHPEHPALCASADEGKCKATAYVIGRDRLTVGNTCGDWAYVQFNGKKSVSRGWAELSRLQLWTTTSVSDALDNSQGPPPFTLMKGKGTSVCDAYLKRLNTQEFEYAPYCGRPEDDSVPGFTRLNRVPLSAESVYELFPRVEGYARMRQQFDSYPGWTLDDARKWIRGAIMVWGYEPQVDIDNDGMPDKVIVWYGFGGQWGISNDSLDCAIRGGRRTSQLAFILDARKNAIDESKTNAVFWRTKHSVIQVDHELINTPFQPPVGKHIDIFKYLDLYYFDTFYDNEGGDVDGKRKNQASLEDRLAVFLHQNGKTKQMCEYRWN